MKRFYLLLMCMLCMLSACKSETGDQDKQVVLTPEFILSVQKYDVLGEFSEGVAAVGIYDENYSTKWGYINTKGEEVIPCEIDADMVGCFSEGLACLAKNGNYFFIDHEGKTVLTIDMPGAQLPDEEIDHIAIHKKSFPCFENGECGLRFLPNKVVYIDRNGQILREAEITFNQFSRQNDTLSIFSEGEGYNRKGLKNEKGSIIVPAQYDDFIGSAESGVILAVIADNSDDDEMMPAWHVGYVDMNGNDTFHEQLKKKLRRMREREDAEGLSAFGKALQGANWIDSKEGFKIPSIMNRNEFFDENIPTTFITYSWGNVLISYCTLGVWAAFDQDFPIPGNTIAPKRIIADVTYKQTSQGIFSGHTSNGHIFYLKRVTGCRGEEIPHPHILVLIYPQDFQDAVQPLIGHVHKWNPL